MRRTMIAAVAGLLVVIVPFAAAAGSARLQARLHSTGNLNIRGTATWAKMSEQTPIVLSVRGARPLSHVVLRVCGPTINSETGGVHGQCWATFVDADRHLLDIAVDRKGRADVKLYPKLGTGPTVLIEAERVEMYVSGNATAPIAVGEFRGWGTTIRQSLSAPTARWR